jgi:PAS domain S-box-containing protein
VTLSQRTILVIISTFIALLFILAASSDFIILSSYSDLEKADITSQAEHISNRIVDKLKQLDESTRDIGEQIKESTGLPVYRTGRSGTLLTEQFLRSQGIDIAVIYGHDGHSVAVAGFDCKNNKICPVSARHQQELAALVSRFNATARKAVQGVVSLDGLPLMLVMQKFDTGNGTGQGVVAFGWFFDDVEMEQSFRASGVTIEIYDLKTPHTPDVQKAAALLNGGKSVGFHAAALDDASIAGYFILKDGFDTPTYIVRIVEKRILYEQGKATIAYIFTALFLSGGVFCLVMLIFMRRAILSRLHSLTALVRQISEKRAISARLPDSEHQDELKTLSDSINSMLESLERSEDRMRESEERYRTLFDKAPDAIIIIGLEDDEAGIIVNANEAAAEQHGYSLSEICGMPIRDLNSDETNKIVGDMISRISQGEWITSEIWHRRKDGTEVPVEIHAGLIKIHGKKYILGFDRDITLRKINEKTDQMHLEQIRQLNDELHRKALDLEAVNNDLETFNYSVSHDMRGPLTRISGYCQLLLDDDFTLEPDVREYITRIYHSELWLNDMIDALLHLAQLNRIEIDSDSVNLSAVTEASLQELALEYPERSVRTSVAPGIVVAGDSRLLKMVMINLVGNAWKYSSGTSDALIEFGVEQTESGPVYFVRDNGVGFDMKDVGKLFRVFARLHDSSQFSGNGIGLATVQRIILRHGGRIWVEAETGVGATFFFTLP